MKIYTFLIAAFLLLMTGCSRNYDESPVIPSTLHTFTIDDTYFNIYKTENGSIVVVLDDAIGRSLLEGKDTNSMVFIHRTWKQLEGVAK